MEIRKLGFLILLSAWVAISFALTGTRTDALPAIATLEPAQCRTAIETYERDRATKTARDLPGFISSKLWFNTDQCTNFALRQRDDLQVLNYYRQICQGVGSPEWNGGDWPDLINQTMPMVSNPARTLQEAFRQDTGREWYWSVAHAPQIGATAHWRNCEFATRDWARSAVLSTHVAYVVGFDATTLAILHNNVPNGSRSGDLGISQVVTRADCIQYILPVDKRMPVPVVAERSLQAPFSIRWPLRQISISTPHRFELRLDDKPNIVLSSSGGTQREYVKQIFLMPGSHTAKIKYWAEASAPAPEFSQAPYVLGQVLADEPDATTTLAIEYSLSTNPSFAQAGDRVTLAYSAREPATNEPISAIEVYINDRLVNRSTGTRGTFVWQTSSGDAGKQRIRLQARIDGFDVTQSRDYEYTIQAPSATAPSGASGYIGFALPHAQADWRESRVPISFSIAQSALESGWGGSGLATTYNNYFGIKCPGLPAHSNCVTLEGSSWRAYANARESFLDHGHFLRQNSRYQNAFSYINDSVSFAREVAKAGYAGADWQTYFDKVKFIMDMYNLYQYDQGGTLPPPSPTTPPPQPAAPNPPALRAPTNRSSWSTSDEIVLSWNPAANATQYKVELWGGPYSTMTPCDWQSGTSCRIGAMREGMMSWHVKARNASGQESDWSDTWSFLVQGETRLITPTPTPTPTPTILAPSDRDLQVIGGLSLSNTAPQVGESVTAIFRFKNVSGRAISITRLVAGARGPNARSLEWNAREVDFPARTNITLQPGVEMEYRESRSFDQPGDYFAEPAWLEAGTTKWEGVWPYPRVWFNVQSRQIFPTPTSTPTATRTPMPVAAPGRLVIVQGLKVSNSNPQVNQSINATYRIRNDGGSPVTANMIGVKGRHSSGVSYDFFWQPNVTVQPGQEFTYDANRAFDRTGSFSLTPNYFDGANWRDLTFANGSTNYVTINVASAPIPPTPTPTRTPAPPPPSPGRVVMTQGLVISPNSPTRGQNVNARFTAKNVGGSPVTFRFFGVKGRHSSGADYSFHWLENFTFQPNQEFTYDVNRTFDRTGSFTFTPNYSTNGSTWADLTFSNGSTSYVTISVR